MGEFHRNRFQSGVRLVACAASLLLSAAPGAVAQDGAEDGAAEPADLVLVLDASGSMWGQIEGENKIVIARRVMDGLIDGMPEGQPVGLVAYGHRREGDCEDIEVVAPLAPLDREGLKEMVNALNPKGKTPITASVERAFGLLEGRETAATVMVVTDGIETCGGDPCEAVRAAKAAGGDFVLHVVGFDVAEEDVSQLECAAQAGGGMYLTAENAGELGAALEAATALAPDIPPGRLVVEAVADGELQDVAISVTDATGEDVISGRTYGTAETNPRALPLADGSYSAEVQAVGIEGDVRRRIDFEIVDSSTVEEEFDFSTGELAIGVTRNGELSDATYHVYIAETDEPASEGRTYTSASSNPAVVRLTAGRYTLDVTSVEIAGESLHQFEEFVVEPGGRIELSHAFESGELAVGAARGGELVDAVVYVYGPGGARVAQGRTYTGARTNPKRFVLIPGEYRVEAKEVRGGATATATVTVGAGEALERMMEMD